HSFHRRSNQMPQAVLPAVYIEGADGTRYSPRFESYDAATNTATFLMLDGLPAGSYTLHLSGREGLTGYGGLPLDGDGPGGDAVVHFRVDGAGGILEGVASGGYVITHRPGSEGFLDLGVLFSRDLEAGITLVREADETPGGEGDRTEEYRFRVLQKADYDFTLSGEDLPDGIRMTLLDDGESRADRLGENQGEASTQKASPRAPTGSASRAGRRTGGRPHLSRGLRVARDRGQPAARWPTAPPPLLLRLNSLPGSSPTDPRPYRSYPTRRLPLVAQDHRADPRRVRARLRGRRGARPRRRTSSAPTSPPGGTGLFVVDPRPVRARLPAGRRGAPQPLQPRCLRAG
ncbi:MAG: hypothetical protein WKF75_03490, partial [Singulisphaera sp.]